MLFITVFVSFSSSKSLLNIYYVSLKSMPTFHFWYSELSSLLLLWILFQVGHPLPLHLFGLAGFCLAASSVAFLSSHFSYVILSYWLIGLSHPALKFAGSWMELGLHAKIRSSRRLNTKLYSMRPEALCQSCSLDLAFPPEELKHNPWPGLSHSMGGEKRWKKERADKKRIIILKKKAQK